MVSWEQLSQLFDEAKTLPPNERASYLDRVCVDNASLRAELERLLDAHDAAGNFMNSPVIPWSVSTVSTSPAVFCVGEKVAGRFRIISFLGVGGMGQVYKAEDEVLGGFVALKTIRPEIALDQRIFERFKQEVSLAKKVTHDNVCRVFDLDHKNVPPYITMELVEGETLSARLRRTGKMTPSEALPLIVQMADGLQAAHRKSVIHGDFKPGNIMLVRTSESATLVKITDFGLARTADQEGSSLTRQVGTVAYMAPDLLAGGKATVASDIYALGLVMYEMVTGVKPEFNRMTEPAPPPSKQTTGLDEKLESAILRCLERDPARRFSSAADVVLAIQGKTGRVDRLERWIRSHPAALVTTAFAALLSLALLLLIPPDQVQNSESTLTQLTADSGLNTYPAISPDGKLVAYASDRSGQGNLDIWLQQIRGGDPIRLTSDPSDDFDPSFSPDTTKVAFRSERNGGGIYMVSTFGGQEQLIARGGFGPKFSPDGKWIAYWVGAPGSGFIRGSSQIYLLPVSGGPAKPFHPEFAGNCWPTWSPDGKQLLFVGDRDGRQETVDWWVAPANGGPARRTGAFKVFDSQKLKAPVGQDWIAPAAWDRNGNRILFSAAMGDSTNIWELPLAPTSGQMTGSARRRTAGTGVELHASMASEPKGSSEMCYSSQNLHVDVWGLPVDATVGRVLGGMQRLTQGLSYAASPSVSADGTKLAFVASRSGRWTVRTRDLETGKDIVHTSSDLNWLRVRISSDGTKIVYAKYTNSELETYFADLDRGTSQKICQDCGPPTDVSRDGNRVLFEPVHPPENVMMVDVGSHQVIDAVNHPSHPDWILYAGRFSPDARWIAFHAAVDLSLNKKIFITPVRDGQSLGEAHWIPVTDGSNIDWHTAWSPDGNMLYFLSDRDGFRCIWAQRLNADTKQPVGKAFTVQHFHHSGHSLKALDRGDVIGMSVANGRIVFALGELTGNIWLSERKGKS